MCDTSAFIVKDGTQELVMSSLSRVIINGTDIEISNIFGEIKKVSGKIKEIDYSENRLVIVF